MKTATIREAQRHLSKLMDEVEKGLEIVPDDPDQMAFKMLGGRLYNAGVLVAKLEEVFRADRKTIRSWGDAIVSRDPEKEITCSENSITTTDDLAVIASETSPQADCSDIDPSPGGLDPSKCSSISTGKTSAIC